MQYLKIYNKQDVLAYTKIRRFETKAGECFQLITDKQSIENTLATSSAKYVLLGIEEDIGVKANFGVGGANTGWQSFLQAFANIQSNDFFSGEEVLLLGHFDFSQIEKVIESNANDTDERVNAYRHAVNTIDDAVENIVKVITEHKKIPIVIGGGHNNAYGCIKGAAKGLYKANVIPLAQINAINLDAHADYRPAEGRHSGNAFRYADEDGYLEKYFVIGLHENYLPQNCWLDVVNDPFIDFITYEDIFLNEKRNFIEAVAHAAVFTDDTYCGIELDIDCIENALSSATSPVGISVLNARQYINFTARECKVAYLHLAEAAAQLSDGRKDETTGKLLAYLVTDFIKAYNERAQV
jgi:formiminoglutamase